MMTGSAEKGPYATESYRQDWIELEGDGSPQYVLEEQRLFHSETDETEYKANGTIDFKVNDSIRLYVKGDIREADRTSYRPRTTLRYKKGDYNNITENSAEVEGAWIERYASGWETDSSEYSITTGGYLDFENLLMDYQISLNDSGNKIPGVVSSKFIRKNVDLAYDLDDEYAPSFALLNGNDPEINDSETYKNDWVSFVDMSKNTRVLLSTANITIPLNKTWFNGYVKSGFKVRGLEYDRSSLENHYDNVDSAFTLADVVGDYDNPDLFGGLYDHGPHADRNEISEYFDTNSSSFEYNQTRSKEESDPETFATGQDVYAGYSMVYFNLNNMRIIAGLRYEKTELDYMANEMILDENGDYQETIPVADSNSYANWFPGIHGRYDKGRFSFIGSWSNTISRPDFERVVPFKEVHRESEYIDTGNPNLKPTLYTNYDFAIDYRLEGRDLLSMEIYYQTLEDIVYYEVSKLESGPYAGYEFGTSKNGPTGDIYGMRFIWSQSIGDWIGIAQGLSFNAKYTHRISETVYPGRPDEVLPMPHRPRNSFHFNLSYKRKKLFAQLEFAYSQASLERINEEAEWRDVYEGSRTRLDFTSSYQIADSVRFLFEVSNITEVRRGEDYYGNEVLLSGYSYSPRRYRLGMKFDL